MQPAVPAVAAVHEAAGSCVPFAPSRMPCAYASRTRIRSSTVKHILHRPDVHAAKSVMVMADVALVVAGARILADLGVVHACRVG